MKVGKNRVITHRGLEPSDNNFWSESSFEAFQNHLSRGFAGIEFDPNPTNNNFFVLHDTNLTRPTGGMDSRNITELTTIEAMNVQLPNGRIPSLSEVFELIRKSNSSMNALHLKSRLQTENTLRKLIEMLKQYVDIHEKLIIFDVKKENVQLFKSIFANLRVCPSVAHPYDIERFNKVVGGTLMTIDEAIDLKRLGLIDGVWADEWDTLGENETKKLFYTKENFNRLHNAGLFIVAVTPELHGTSPGLYGGESHKDGLDKKTLFDRIKEIKNAGADFFCTDYPDEVSKL